MRRGRRLTDRVWFLWLCAAAAVGFAAVDGDMLTWFDSAIADDQFVGIDLDEGEVAGAGRQLGSAPGVYPQRR